MCVVDTWELLLLLSPDLQKSFLPISFCMCQIYYKRRLKCVNIVIIISRQKGISKFAPELMSLSASPSKPSSKVSISCFLGPWEDSLKNVYFCLRSLSLPSLWVWVQRSTGTSFKIVKTTDSLMFETRFRFYILQASIFILFGT